MKLLLTVCALLCVTSWVNARAPARLHPHRTHPQHVVVEPVDIEPAAEEQQVKEMTMREAVMARLEALEKKSSPDDIAIIQRQLQAQKALLNTVEKEADSLAKTNEDLKLAAKRMADTRHNDSSTHVAFAVALTYDYTSSGNNIAFDHIYYNVGNHWDATYYSFRAPYNGVYAFQASCFSADGETSTCRITRSGLSTISMHGVRAGGQGHGNQVVLELLANELVAVRLLEGEAHSTYDDHYTTFSGHLLYQI